MRLYLDDEWAGIIGMTTYILEGGLDEELYG